MTGVTIELRFATVESERRFLERYLPTAWDRYETNDYWKQGWFWPYGAFESLDIGLDGGLVRLVFDGDPDALIAAESDRWKAYDGFIEWEVTRYDEKGFENLRTQQIETKGTVGGDWEYRYKPLTARFALAYREEFANRLPSVCNSGVDRTENGRDNAANENENPRSGEDDSVDANDDQDDEDENPLDIGMWSLVHSLFVQCGYDWYEENDAYVRGLQSRIKSIALYRGEEAAREEYQRVRDEIAEFDSELNDWLDEHRTGNESI